MNKVQAYHAFWSGFGLTAYDENSVPDNAKLPYITYGVSEDDFDHLVLLSASIWYKSNSWVEITAKEQQIADFITKGGKMVAYDGGAMWIQKGSPWAQRMSDASNYDVRRMLLNITVEFMD